MPVKGPRGNKKPLKKGMGLYDVQHLPDKAPDKSKPWAVVNLQTGDIRGRWHPDEASARDQQKALYAQLGKKARFRMGEHDVESYMVPISFAEIPGDTIWVEALPARIHHTMQYGEVTITEDKLHNLINNFKSGVRGQDVATDYDHGMDRAKGNKASGWYKDFDVRNGSLWAEVKLTKEAKQEIADGQWKYFSLEWEDMYEDHKGDVHKDVIVGGGFTNRPIAKGMVPINFSELFEVEPKQLRHQLDTGSDDASAMSEQTDAQAEKELNANLMEDESTQTVDEHAAEEHQEPGSDSPDPTLNEDDSFPDRHVTLPADNDDDPGTSDSKEDEVDEAKLREVLGIGEDVDIIKAATELKEKVGPLEEVAKQFSERKKFAEMFPDEARELEAARMERRDNAAIKFSEEVGRKRFADNKGLSAKSLEKVASLHKAFSEGTANVDAFTEVIDTIADEGGLVEFGERGSSRVDADSLNTTPEHPRIAFAEKVKEVMVNDELDYGAAVTEASKRYPDLAKAYAAPVRA